MHDHRVRISADVQPAPQDAINHREQQPTEPGFQALYYLVRYWLDLPAAHGREGETYCSAAIADSYPALDQIAAKRVTDLICVDCLPVRRCKIIGHPMKVSVRDQRAGRPSTATAMLRAALALLARRRSTYGTVT